jgi:DNA-directed RNA polymerase specialized sigma24 family protein
VLRCRAVPRDDDEVRAQPGEDGDPARAADAALVVAARGGDQQAFGRLFDRWFDPVHDIAWRIVRDRDVAAEVAQDVFLVAWQGLGELEQPGSFGGWVRRIARNRALNRLDRERRSRPDSEAAAAALDRGAPDVDMTAALGEREQNELVWAAAAGRRAPGSTGPSPTPA